QPVNLTDDATTTPAHASPSGEVEGMKVSRRQVGDFLADAALNREHQQACVALSARPQKAPAPQGALR
ncbi:MAG: SDR family oxidoreductase, partial [Gammaproteobacteria bacterium]|nr:SDR family oxidoreductase [Gammaproteobacteria bacterium]